MRRRNTYVPETRGVPHELCSLQLKDAPSIHAKVDIIRLI